MVGNQDLETKVKTQGTLSAKIADGLKGVPPILGCTAGAYLLDFSKCISEVTQNLPSGLNVGYHLAAGSGLYGGFTGNSNRKVTSLVALAASFVPDLAMFSNGEFKDISAVAGSKLVGYGLGYIVGYLLSNK